MSEPNTWHAPYRYERAPGAPYGQIAKIGDRLVCHICGRDFVGLGAHVWWTHGMTANQYRAEFDLPASAKLESKSVIEKVRHAAFTNGAAQRFRDIDPEQRSTVGQFKRGDPRIQLGTLARRRYQDKLGMWATVHDLVDKWKDGRPIDAEVVRLGEIIEARLQKMADDRAKQQEI